MLVTGDRSKHWQHWYHKLTGGAKEEKNGMKNMTTHKWIDTEQHITKRCKFTKYAKGASFHMNFYNMLHVPNGSLYLLAIHCLVTCPPANGIDTNSTEHKRNRCTCIHTIICSDFIIYSNHWFLHKFALFASIK